MYKLDLEKAEEHEIKLPTFIGSWRNPRKFQKIIYCFTDYAKAFDCVDHNKLWKILKEMGVPDYLTCLLRNLYAGQEATVRTGHGTTDWFKMGKEYDKATYCHPAYLTSMQSNLDRVLKSKRYHFAHKDLYSQSYGFSSSSCTDMRVGP